MRQRCARAVRKALADLGTQDLCLVLPREQAKTLHPHFFELRAENH